MSEGFENSYGVKLLPDDAKSKKQTEERDTNEGVPGTAPSSSEAASVPEGPSPRVDENPFEPGHEPPPRGSEESIPKKGILSPPKKPFSYKIHGKNVSFGSVVVQVFSSEVVEESPGPVAVISAPDEVPPDILWSKVREEKSHAQRILASSNGANNGSLIGALSADKLSGHATEAKKPSSDSAAHEAGLSIGGSPQTSALGAAPVFNGLALGSSAPPFPSFAPSGLATSPFAVNNGLGSSPGLGAIPSPMTSSQNSPLNSPIGRLAGSQLGVQSPPPGLSAPFSSQVALAEEDGEDGEEDEEDEEDE